VTPRTTPLVSLDNRSYWRRLLATVHPDRDDGDAELFVFLTALKEHVEQCTAVEVSRRYDNFQAAGTSKVAPEDDSARVPFDCTFGSEDQFYRLTHRALSIGQTLEEPFRSLLLLLLDCCPTDHGRRADKQSCGATYKQLAYIAHLVPCNKEQRVRWYEICRSIPLAEAHASHIISSLKCQAAA
jgi:hypothetical protein